MGNRVPKLGEQGEIENKDFGIIIRETRCVCPRSGYVERQRCMYAEARTLETVDLGRLVCVRAYHTCE